MVESYFPESLEEALELLNKEPLIIMAGGTDLMVRNRNWSNVAPEFPRSLLFINQINALKYMLSHEGNTHIGASVTLEEVLEHHNVPILLKEAISEMASPAIRHTGTLIGNVGNASPAGDTLPVLYVLNTKVVLVSNSGTRVLPIQDFILGPGKIDRKDNELIKELIVENPHEGRHYFSKIGGRKSDAISKVCFAGYVNKLVDTHGKTSCDIRMAFGAVGPTVVRVPTIETSYSGLDKETISSRFKEDYIGYIKPIDDQRSSADYRKQVAINIALDFIDTCL